MRRNNKNLALLILLALYLNLSFNTSIFAQSTTQDESRKKEFGSSLKKFEEKKGKTDSKNENQNTRTDDDTIRVNTDLVINDVLVVNENGNPVIGLNQSDFIVKEDTIPQKVELFSFGENAVLPRSIVLLFHNGYKHRFNEVRNYDDNNVRAAKLLVDRLAPQDKMAIVTTNLKLVLDFSTDKKLLKKTLDNLSEKRQEEVSKIGEYGTLIAVLNEMFDEKDVRPIVIFQVSATELMFLKETDAIKLPEGAPTRLEMRQIDEDVGKKNPTPKEIKKEIEEIYPIRKYGFNDVLESIEKSRATIYSIIPYMRFVGHSREEQIRRGRITSLVWLSAFNTDLAYINRKADEHKENAANGYILAQSAMIQVAATSGGLTNFIEQPKDAEKVYNDIFTIINNRYTIGYYSTNEKRDGKPRNVKIEVKGHPNYKIISRNTYIAPEK